MIALTTKIEDIVKKQSKMIAFFNEQRIDYCCQGYKTIAEVAGEKDLDSADFLTSIETAMESFGPTDTVEMKTSLEDFKKLSLDEMIDSIIRDHHDKERELLSSIDPLLNKILTVHFENHGEELLALHKLFGGLKNELEIHFVKEEKITFPIMRSNPSPSADIVAQVEDLESDHEKAGILIKQMIDLTNGFAIPEDACRTFTKTYEDLDKLTKDVFIHIFKENSILFEKFKN